MQELSTRINQSCHLVVRSGTQGLVILRQENQKRHANLSVRLGAVIELATSCSGQVLLAHLDPAEREQLLQTIPRPRAISRAKLQAALDKVRKRGYEIHPSPITAGVTDISYPIRGFDGKVMAALTIPYLHALDNSLPTSVEKTRRLVEEAARRISQSLGWTRPAGNRLFLPEHARREIFEISPPCLPLVIGAGRLPVHVFDSRFGQRSVQAANAGAESLGFRGTHAEVQQMHLLRECRRDRRTRR